MALMECAECGEEVSDKAFSCPHCGNPLRSESFPPRGSSQSISQTNSVKNKKKHFPLLWTMFLVVIALIPVCFVISETFINPSPKSSLTSELPEELASLNQVIHDKYSKIAKSTDSNKKNNLKSYGVQETNLWGYKLYTSKVDQTGNIDIGSEAKQSIAKLLKGLGYPPNLTQSLAIVYVDPTIARGRMEFPWEKTNLVAISSQPEGGIYNRQAGGAVIYINSLKISNKSILTHELGHQIGYHLTDEEWTQFYKLRGIPENTPRHGNDWDLSPEEDFAEVYKAAYKSSVANEFERGDWSVNTQYGFLMPSMLGIDYDTTCRKLFDQIRKNYTDSHSKQAFSSEMWSKAEAAADANPKVQECRKTNNGKSPLGGKLYVSQTDKATEQFIKNVVARLNKP